jgi:hypothetical protein
LQWVLLRAEQWVRIPDARTQQDAEGQVFVPGENAPFARAPSVAVEVVIFAHAVLILHDGAGAEVRNEVRNIEVVEEPGGALGQRVRRGIERIDHGLHVRVVFTQTSLFLYAVDGAAKARFRTGRLH